MANDVNVIVGYQEDQSSRAKVINNMATMGEQGARKFSYALGRITGSSSEFEKSMSASNARVLAFGASAGSIYAIGSAFKKLVESTIQVEKELANINLYMNLGSNSLKQFSANLFSIATKTASPFQDAAKAAQEFSRQGLTMNEVLKRTSDALTLSRLTGLGMEDAITDLTSIMNSFNKESLNTTMIVDRLSSVGGKFAVSADAIAEALKRVGSSASDVGVQFDEMIALITSTQHITGRAASVIGTSFNTIFARLQRPKVLEDLESVGVSIRNTAGTMLPMIQIIKNLSTTYEGLSSSQKSFISETVGGVRQLNLLKALFTDLGGGYSYYGRAIDAAANSTGIAQKRISALNETISAQLQQTATTWQEVLSNVGNIVINPSIKGGTKGLTDIGQKLAKNSNPNTDDLYARTVQGGLKSIGNIFSGPGIQIGFSILYKLFDKLAIFGAQSLKDLMGTNKVAKDRAIIEEHINQLLAKNPGFLTSALGVEKEITLELQKQYAFKQQSTFASQSYVGGLIRNGQSSGVAGMIAGGSKIPNLHVPNLAGYSGYSMSNNAVRAYSEGKLPASKAATEFGFKSAKNVRENFSPTEWHHTSSKYNMTDFFDIDADLKEKSLVELAQLRPNLTKKGIEIIKRYAKQRISNNLMGEEDYVIGMNRKGKSARIRELMEKHGVPYHRRYGEGFFTSELSGKELSEHNFIQVLNKRNSLMNPSKENSSVQAALNAENQATHGHAGLSSSPVLVSDSNPLGLAAIDTRTQGNATEAVNQHMALGQSLNDIKSGNTSKVPGLAMDSTLLASAFMGFSGGMVNTHKYDNDDYTLKLRQKLLLFGDAVDKQIYTIQKLTAAQNALSSGKEVEKFNLPGNPRNYGPYKTNAEFDKDFKKEEYSETTLANLQQARAQAQSARQNAGLKLAIGGAIGGGMLSTYFQNSNPNLARGFEKGFGDVELAGQAKMFLPEKAGKIASTALIAQGIGDFAKEIDWKSMAKSFGLNKISEHLPGGGTANLERDFAKQQEIVQKVNSSLDALAQSINTLEQNTLDSSVSFEALTREQRKYEEALNQFQGSGAKFEQIQNIRNAPNSKTRMRAIEELRESYNDNLENQALGLSLNQRQSQRGGLSTGFGKIGQKSLFSWSNEIEKDQSLTDINDVASRALANMSASEKSKFEKEVMNRGINSKLGVNNIYGDKNAFIRESLNNGSQSDRDAVVQQIKFLTTQSAVEKDPKVRQARLEATNQNQAIGLPLDMATRQEEMMKRLFINSTAMNVNNSIQGSLARQNIGFAGESIGLSARQGYAGILGLTAGQRTNIGFQEESEKQRIDLETRRKLAQSNSNFTSKLVSPYTQNAEQWVAQNKDILTPGGNSQAISDTVKNFTESINRGLTGTVEQNNGNLSSFIGGNGQLNEGKLNRSILENSGLSAGSNEYNNLSKFLTSTAGSEEQLKEINAHLIENTQITMEGNQSIVEASIKSQAAQREYQIQQNASVFGGLQTPHQGLQIASQFRRSQSLMNSSNPIIAGIGALNYLKLIKEYSGQDVNLSDENKIQSGRNKGLYKTGNQFDSLTNDRHKAANLALKGYALDYQRSASRVGGSVGNEMLARLSREGYDVGADRLKNLIHPEQTQTGAMSGIDTTALNAQINKFSTEMIEVINPITHFGKSLDGLADKINTLHAFINNPGGQRETTQNAQDANNQRVQKLEYKASLNGTPNPTKNEGGEITTGQKVASGIGGANWGLIGGLTATALMTKTGRGLLSKGANKIGLAEKIAATKGFMTKDRAWPWRTPKPMSRDFENIPSSIPTSVEAYDHATWLSKNHPGYNDLSREERNKLILQRHAQSSKPLGGLRPGAVSPEIQPYYNSQNQGEFGFGNKGGYEGYPALKPNPLAEPSISEQLKMIKQASVDAGNPLNIGGKGKIVGGLPTPQVSTIESTNQKLLELNRAKRRGLIRDNSTQNSPYEKAKASIYKEHKPILTKEQYEKVISSSQMGDTRDYNPGNKNLSEFPYAQGEFSNIKSEHFIGGIGDYHLTPQNLLDAGILTPRRDHFTMMGSKNTPTYEQYLENIKKAGYMSHPSSSSQLEIPPATYRSKINTEADLGKTFADITLKGTKSPIDLFKKQNIMPSMGKVPINPETMTHLPESWIPKVPKLPETGYGGFFKSFGGTGHTLGLVGAGVAIENLLSKETSGKEKAVAGASLGLTALPFAGSKFAPVTSALGKFSSVIGPATGAVDAWSTIVGGMVGKENKGNRWAAGTDAMADKITDIATSRLTKKGAHLGGDIWQVGTDFSGASLKSAFVAKDIARQMESEGGVKERNQMEYLQERSKKLGIRTLSSFHGDREAIAKYRQERVEEVQKDENMKKLNDSIVQLKTSFDKVNAPENEQEGTSTTASQPITIKIDIQDLDKAPQKIKDGIIAPLLQQLQRLVVDVNNIKANLGIAPSPSQVSHS